MTVCLWSEFPQLKAGEFDHPPSCHSFYIFWSHDILELQELLKSYGNDKLIEDGEDVENASNKQSKNTVFTQLPEDVRTLVKPYLDSRYVLQVHNVMPPAVVFTASGLSFRRWLYSWLRTLIENFADGEHLSNNTYISLVLKNLPPIHVHLPNAFLQCSQQYNSVEAIRNMRLEEHSNNEVAFVTKLVHHLYIHPWRMQANIPMFSMVRWSKKSN